MYPSTNNCAAQSNYSNNPMLYETQIMSSSVMYASPNNIGDPTWFPDSGTSHHVVSDPLNLAISIEFIGNE